MSLQFLQKNIHSDGPKIAICETASKALYIIDTSFTTKDHYFHHALAEACDAFNATVKDFGYFQQLEAYDPATHQYHVQQKHPI